MRPYHHTTYGVTSAKINEDVLLIVASIAEIRKKESGGAKNCRYVKNVQLCMLLYLICLFTKVAPII